MSMTKHRSKAVAAVAALALALTACGGGAAQDPKAPVDTAALKDKMVGAMTDFKAGTTFKATEPVTFSLLYRDHPNYPYNADWDFFTQVKKNQNVSFDPVNVPLSDWNQRRALLIGAGDAPQIIPSTYIADAEQYTASGAILPVSKYLEYMPNFSEKIEKYGLKDDLDATRQGDGEFYVLPGLLETAKPTYTIAIRDDLFKKAGITKDPETWEEFAQQLKTVDAANPDLDYVYSERWSNNGPIEATLQLASGSFGTEAGWGYGDGVTWDGSKYVYTGAMDEYKALIQYFGGLIKDGLLDPESVTQDDKDAVAKFTSGRTAVIGSNDQEILNYRKTLADGGHTDAVVRQIVVPAGPAGSRMDAGTGGRFESGVVLSSKAADSPNFVALLQFVDWMYFSDEGNEFSKWGVEGETYTKSGDKRTLNAEIDINGLNPGAPKKLNADYGYHNGVFMLSHGTTTDLLNSMLRPEVVEFRAAMNKKETADNGPGIALTEDQREQATLARTALQDAVMQNTSQFLLGQRSFDTWDAYKTELENAGMSRYVELVNSAANKR